MIRIFRNNKIVKAVVPLTPSKSITNRVLIIRALCDEKFEILNHADADDSKILAEILENLTSFIDAKDAGTVYRFLTAFLSITSGTFFLTGTDRMKNRPIGELVKILQSFGADLKFTEKDNYPPLEIEGKPLRGGIAEIDASESSQFVSALLLIAPMLTEGLKLELKGKINSRPYILMTLSLMQYYGIKVYTEGNFISIPPQKYISQELIVENDWSAASFWYVIAALSDEAEISLRGLFLKSVQGDSVITAIMEAFGVYSIVSGDNVDIIKKSKFIKPELFEYDFSSCPDLVIPLAVICSALKIPSVFNGVSNLKIKESDRLISLKEELSKIGTEVKIQEDSFSLKHSSENKINGMFHSHKDHRIVMALAPLALLYDEVLIDDHLPVSKSYPGFWEQLQSAEFNCTIT